MFQSDNWADHLAPYICDFQKPATCMCWYMQIAVIIDIKSKVRLSVLWAK